MEHDSLGARGKHARPCRGRRCWLRPHSAGPWGGQSPRLCSLHGPGRRAPALTVHRGAAPTRQSIRMGSGPTGKVPPPAQEAAPAS